MIFAPLCSKVMKMKLMILFGAFLDMLLPTAQCQKDRLDFFVSELGQGLFTLR